jgi:medium-chain acyl-[acyl-carrier-protein] hydrolase
MSTGRWFLKPPQKPGKMRLYCFSHAGGNALGFIPWRPLLSPAIELAAVQLPGRGLRTDEPASIAFDELAARIAAEIALEAPLPSVFFGHSMGALLAFEVARACRAQGQPGPVRLVLSGSPAPRAQRSLSHLRFLPDDMLIAALGGLNGTPSQVLKMNALMRRTADALRADLNLRETYRYYETSRLEIPLTVLYGRQDHLVRPEALLGWRQETTASCALHGFDGDHFFINTLRAGVVDLIQRIMLAGAPPVDAGVRSGGDAE